MMKPVTVLTEDDVVAILKLLQEGTSHRIIAERFSVSKKTISRISTGETWKEVSLRYNMQAPAHSVPMPKVALTGTDPELCDLLDEVTAVKNHFGFDFTRPLYWGWFEGWDGLHALVSDGFILWESTDLVEYAKKIVATGINEAPFFASTAEELPTFELEDIMSQPVGARYEVDAVAGNIVRLVHGEQVIFLRAKHTNIAQKMKLEIRAAGSTDKYVYLTRNKPKSPNDPLPVVIACVTTLTEATGERRLDQNSDED